MTPLIPQLVVRRFLGNVNCETTSYLGNINYLFFKMGDTGPITTSMIAPFRGDGDLVAWLTKVKLVAKLKKRTDLAAFVPLFLEGDALTLYLEMS